MLQRENRHQAGVGSMLQRENRHQAGVGPILQMQNCTPARPEPIFALPSPSSATQPGLGRPLLAIAPTQGKPLAPRRDVDRRDRGGGQSMECCTCTCSRLLLDVCSCWCRCLARVRAMITVAMPGKGRATRTVMERLPAMPMPGLRMATWSGMTGARRRRTGTGMTVGTVRRTQHTMRWASAQAITLAAMAWTRGFRPRCCG